jgi:hypothetical protein
MTTLTNDQIVTAALRKLAVLGDGMSPSTSQLTNGTQALTTMLSTFAVKGLTNLFATGIPDYCLEAVIYGLAYRLSPEYGIPLQDRQLLAGEAQKFLNDALEYSAIEDSMFLQPDWTTYL